MINFNVFEQLQNNYVFSFILSSISRLDSGYACSPSHLWPSKLVSYYEESYINVV